MSLVSSDGKGRGERRRCSRREYWPAHSLADVKERSSSACRSEYVGAVVEDRTEGGGSALTDTPMCQAWETQFSLKTTEESCWR